MCCGLVGVSVLAGSCGGGSEPVAPPQIASVTISPTNPSPIPAGGTLQLSAVVLDTRGQVISGQAITYTSSAPQIASVSNQGVVSAPGPVGTVDITASAGGRTSNSVSLSVVAAPTASITRTSADPANVSPGGSAGDSVRYRVADAFGNPRQNETVTFTVAAGNGVASPASAQTDAQGRAATKFRTGTTAGQNTLTVTVGSLAPLSFSLTTVPSSVSISSVAPSPMTPGGTVTINGSGFSATATDDAVTIDGVPATITNASATQITLVVPSALPCTPTHSANLEVIVNGASAFAQQILRMGTIRTVAVGGTLVLGSPAEIACTELSPAGAEYVVNVVNMSEASSSFTPFRFSGATTVPSSAAPTAGAFVLRQSMSRQNARPRTTVLESQLRGRAASHTRMLEINRSLYRELRRNRSLAPRSVSKSAGLRAFPGLSAAAAIPVVGDTRRFRVGQFSGGSGTTTCQNYLEITAKVVFVGAKSIIYEDTAAPLAGQMDAHFVQLGQEFEATMYPTVSNYFGDPLVNDANTDADQHLNMVFTPAVPSSALGFVSGCDLFPRTTKPQSNFGENFYGVVATVAGTGFTSNTADQWLRLMRSTVVHEVKHIASNGAHIVNDAAAFEEIWLEEGMAMIAEEVWVRDAIYHTTFRGNADYASTLRCDVRPVACPGNPPFVMYYTFPLLYDFLDQAGSFSLFGDGGTYYGTTWSFIRWSADRYASSEAGFLRAITQATNVFGIGNVARQTGAAEDQLLANWSLALYLDEHPATAANPDLKFQSWNMRDIFRGMSVDFPQFFAKQYPLVPQVIATGDFTVDNAGILGGSFATFDLSSVVGSTRAIGLGPSGVGDAGLHLVIARIQ